jgi:hypothetical protein
MPVLIVHECRQQGRRLLPLLAASAASPHVRHCREHGPRCLGQFQMGEAIGPKLIDAQPHEPIREVPG